MDTTIIGSRLKTLRLKNDMTLRQLAKIVGLTPQACQSYESGRIKPSPAVLVKLANCFGVEVDYLLGRDMTPKSINPHKIELDQLKPNSEERAKQIIAIALKEAGWAGVSLTIDAKAKYLEGKMGDDDFFRAVRELIFVMTENARARMMPDKQAS